MVAAAAEADLAPHRRDSLAAAGRYGTWDDAIGRLIGFYGRQMVTPPSLAGPWTEPQGNRTASEQSARVG